MTDSSTCAQCNKTTQDLGRSPKPCAKCRRASYCDRDCQKAHWKQHKQVCRLGLLPSATAGTSSSSSPNPTAGSTATSTPQNLERQIPQPFHRLHEKKWLHDRPENDVFKLLIDTYRLRMEDNYIAAEPDADSLHAGARTALPSFRKFLAQAERRAGLLPPWWDADKKSACLAYGQTGDWADLKFTVEKHDIVEHYGEPLMPMQLRVFGEQIIGTGPRGQSGAMMMQMQMRAESGQMAASVVDVNQSRRE